MSFDKAKQDANNEYTLLGVTASGEIRAIITDEDGNLLVSVNDVILTSPNGTKYQLKIDNDGNISSTLI